MKAMSHLKIQPASWMMRFASIAAILICSSSRYVSCNPDQQFEDYRRLMRQLESDDSCGTIYTSKLHGYEIIPYVIDTQNNQTITLHRLVHPADFPTRGPVPGSRKPYLLVHGLLGTSASYITNIADDYRAPETSNDIFPKIAQKLKSSYYKHEYEWKSTADRYRKESAESKVDKWKPSESKKFARIYEPDYDGDSTVFARVYRQAYKRFELDREDLSKVTNSLAMSLSNFGNDVWMINIRGNHYSQTDKWDFRMDTIAKEDLPAAIKFIERTTKGKPGLVAYSYGNMYLLRLLNVMQSFHSRLEPIVMVAPTLMSSSGQPVKRSKKMIVKVATKALIGKDGPFPTTSRERGIESIICSLPVAAALCRISEHMLHGGTKRVASISNLVLKDRTAGLAETDMDCGRTSNALIHQLINNYINNEPMSLFRPYIPPIRVGRPNLESRRNFLLVHAESDDVSNTAEVERMRNVLLQTKALIDYTIVRPEFKHEDFLFSRRNQFLVNAEIVRMTQIFDYLVGQKSANEPTERLKVQ